PMMFGRVLTVGMEVDRRDGQDQVFDFVGVQGRITGREHTAFANAEQSYPIMTSLPANALDGRMDVVIDIVIDFEPALRAAWPAPIDQPEIEPLRKQTADQRSIGLKIGHRVAAYQTIGHQDRYLAGIGCDRLV